MEKYRGIQYSVVSYLLASMLITAGCATERGWTYKAGSIIDRTPISSRSVAVIPFADERSPENSNKILMYLIPLMPFGWQNLDTPEVVNVHLASGQWQFKPNEDFAKALATDVSNSNIFKEAFFTFREKDADLVLRGTITSTKYKGKLISYLLGPYGPLLWLVGFPAGTVENHLAIKLALEDEVSGNVIWEKAYDIEHDEGVFWIYSLPSDMLYADMLAKLRPKILADLEEVAKSLI